MGCDTYWYHDYRFYFSETDDATSCLCTFPHNNQVFNNKIWFSEVRSMAYLGAAIALAHDRFFEDKQYICLPQDLPQWIKDEIDSKIPIPQEELVEMGVE